MAVGCRRSAISGQELSEPGFRDLQDWGTCDKSHYYKHEGESQKSGIGVPSYQEGLSYLNDLGCCVVLSEFGEVVSAECEFEERGLRLLLF